MTPAVEDDFADFVRSRWPDLEAVALVATLDPGTARTATAAALAGLRAGWAATLETGAPTATARRALLERLDHGRRHRRDPRRDNPAVASPAPRALRSLVEDPDSSVASALLDALAREEPPIRAALAAEVAWRSEPHEVAALTADAAATSQARAGAHPRLLAAHRHALATDGHPAADHRLVDDLADLVARLKAAQPDPPDPAELVVTRARRIHRRSVLGAGSALLGVGALGWAATAAIGGDPARSGLPSPAASGAVDPDDPVWSSVLRWPPRGGLAGDLGIRALAAGSGVRLLHADDVEGLRVVVAASLADQRPDGAAVRAWAGPAGTPPEQLAEVTVAGDTALGAVDAVALGVPRGPGALLLLLTRPGVGSAEVSLTALPTAAGSVTRMFRSLRLSGGVGSLRLDAPLGVAARVRIDGDARPVLTPSAWQVSAGGADPVASLAEYVASATGVPGDRIGARALVDSVTPGSILDPSALSATGGDGRVVLSSATTPDGAVVRGLWVTGDGRGRPASLVLPPVVVPAEAAGAPVLLRLGEVLPRTGRFLVVAPGGGATCQIIATNPNAYPVSKVTPMKGETAVVPVVNADDAAVFRLVVKDATGRTTYDAVPPVGRDLLTLGGDSTGWLGLPLS